MDTTSAHFEPLGEVVADDRSRIPFGKAGVRRDDRYAIAVSGDGEILLTPLATIPKRELIIWEDELLRISLATALQQSANDEVEDLGDFSRFADDGLDEDDPE